MPNGPLSSLIASIQSEITVLSAVSGLPPDMQAIQADAIALFRTSVQQIATAQTLATGFAGPAMGTLDGVSAQVSANNIAGALSAIQTLQTQATETQDKILQIVQQTQSANSQANGWVATIATTQARLTAQKNSLQAQLDSKRSDADSAKKKELYLIALGPLGLVGLAVAMGIYSKLQSEVDDLNNQANDIANQLNTVTATGVSVGALQADLQSGVGAISSLRNAVEFVSTDVGNVIASLSASSDPKNSITVITLFVQTCRTELTTVLADAS
jgi:hypothetical protein